MAFQFSYPQQAMLRALHYTTGDLTLEVLAHQAGTNAGSAKRTLLSLEDRGLAREQFNGTWSPQGRLPEGC